MQNGTQTDLTSLKFKKPEPAETNEIPTFEYLRPWVVKFAAANVWRTAPVYDVDDLVQEAGLKYIQCCERYGTDLDPAHFATIFRTSVHRRIHDLSNSRTNKFVSISIPSLEDAGLGFEGSGFEKRNSVESLPADVRELLGSDPSLAKFAEEAVYGNVKRFSSIGFEPTSHRLARIARLPRAHGTILREKIDELREILLEEPKFSV